MIKVKLKPEQGIKVKLTPSQSHEVNLKTVYLYDPDWIPEIDKAVSDAKESADNAKVSEQNAAQSASDADADATNAAESATIAYNSEQNAIAQANKATEEANAAAESAYQAQTSALAAYEYASNAEADAQNALETLGHVLVAETNATNAATTATEKAGIATQKATEAGTHATNAGVSATNAKTSEDNAKNYELGAKGYSETATQEANASAESAYQSQQSALASAQYASDAESDAQNALETLGHVLESETISTNAANTATQKAQDAAESATDAKESAEEAQRIKDSLGTVYVFKGTVATFSDLPTNASVGDVYDVLDTGENYAWDGSKWDDIGGTVDLSAYAKTTYVDAREQAIREDYMQADSELQTQINGQAAAITEAQGDIATINGKIPTSASSTNLLVSSSDLTNATQDVRSDFAEADSDLQTQITSLSGTVATNQTDIVNLKAQKYGADLSYADSQLQLLDQDGNSLGSPVEISVDTSNAANIDLSNLSQTGQEILDNKLNKQMISNCITEIPQDIKLELTDGVLTLKAGTTVYIPNGSGVFDKVITKNDIIISGSGSNEIMIVVNRNGTGTFVGSVSAFFSGSSQPTISVQYAYWYDTTNNVIKYTSDTGASWTTLTCSLPIGIVTSVSGTVTSINQVFNGFGYIGSTVFALPGVKGLIPYGRNEDGSLNNIERTLPTVTTRNLSGTGEYVFGTNLISGFDYVSANTVEYTNTPSTTCRRYYGDDNYWRNNENGTTLTILYLATATLTSGVVSNFKHKTPFHAVDYYDFKSELNEKVNKSGDTMTGSLTINGGGVQHVVVLKTKYAYNEIPSTSSGVGKFLVWDKNNQYMTQIGCERFTDGSTKSLLKVHSPADPSTSSEICIRAKSDGTFYTYAPTPSSVTDNATKIATTAWCTNASKTGNLFGAPNYSGVVTWTGTGKKTASTNGILHIYRTDHSCNIVGTINGTVKISVGRDGSSYWDDVSSQFLMKKGDYFNITERNGSNVIVYFIPCL